MSAFYRCLCISLLLACSTIVSVADGLPTPNSPLPATDPAYHLSPGDTVSISVYNEPDLTITQTLGHSGEVRLPLINGITLGGMSVREAEQAVEESYRDHKFLRDPVVTVGVVAYFPREVSVLGAVRIPGTVVFPRDNTSLDIVDVITRVGGFLPISKSEAVTITRRLPDGRETVMTVDMDSVISGRQQSGRDHLDVPIFPGDRIWVPERLF